VANLLHFLTDLAVNPAKQMSFINYPHAVMTAAGLSQMEQTIIESRNRRQISSIFADTRVPMANICGDPGPDPLPDPDPN
jgi:hypothetical protein